MTGERNHPIKHAKDQLLVHEAAAADVDAIHRLYQDWEGEAITYGFVSPGETEIGQALGPYFLVADVYGCLVGLISGTVRSSEGLAVIPKGEKYLEINDLYVSPGYRHQKIGSRLMDQLLAIAKKDGMAHALVYSTSKDIHQILSFYESHGFSSWYIQMVRNL